MTRGHFTRFTPAAGIAALGLGSGSRWQLARLARRALPPRLRTPALRLPVRPARLPVLP